MDEAPLSTARAPHESSSGAKRRIAALTTESPIVNTRIGEFLTWDTGPAARYGFSIGITLLAWAVTATLLPHLERVVFICFWPAVLASALFGGFGPAALASVLSVLIVDLTVVPSAGQASTLATRDVTPLIVFLVASLAMSSVANIVRVARRRAASATNELADIALQLDEQATELEQQLEESQALQEELEQTSAELSERTHEAEAAEAFTRGILASIADPFVVQDAEWRFRYINAQAGAIFARTAHGPVEELIGQRVWDVFPDLAAGTIQREMMRAASERVAVTFEAYYADTSTWSVISCYPLPDGGLATQWKDITARRRAEETARYLARASEVLGSSLDYETTLSELAHVVVPELAEWCTVHVVDRDGTPRQLALAHVDPMQVKWAEELNRRYPPDPNATTGVPNVLRTGVAEVYPDITDEMLSAGAVDEEQRRITLALGLRSAIIVPLVANGRILGALSLFSVRSGRRYGDEDLALAKELARRAALAVDNALLHRTALEARAAADEANMVKMQFLAVMSHELRTPLNAIGGYTDLIRLGLRGPVSPEQVQDLDRITLSQRNLLGLINDILNFAKVEAGHVEFKLVDLAVAPLLGDLETVIAPQLLAAGLTLDRHDCPPQLAVRADAEKVRQIMLNLLSNAIKFTAPGGKIAVRCARVGDRVRVAVTDTGIGIAEDRLGAVFDPFVQLDRTLTSRHEGTGLGLSISRDLARAMGGEISARSALDQGSTFSLELPAAGVAS
jgi:signal transduction histidine kinase/PAS domain-containing protein